MTQHPERDDRFDRRELLLHLGDMLDAAQRVAEIREPDAPVAQLASRHAALRRLAFLEALAPTITAARFGTQIASAFAAWPRVLLEPELDRDALARGVQRALFDGDAAGWTVYVTFMREKVAWFADRIGDAAARADAGPATAGNATVVAGKPPVEAAKPSKPARRAEKKGWPWPEPRS